MQNGSQGNGQSGDVSQGIQVRSAACAANPKPLLTGRLETGVVTLAFCAQGVKPLEAEAVPVNREPIVVGQRFIFGTAPIFLPIVPIFMITGAAASFGLPERAAEFLSDTAAVSSFAVLVHGKARFTDWVAHRQLFGVFGSALVQRNDCFAFVSILYQAVDRFHIVTLVAQEGTLSKR